MGNRKLKGSQKQQPVDQGFPHAAAPRSMAEDPQASNPPDLIPDTHRPMAPSDR